MINEIPIRDSEKILPAEPTASAGTASIGGTEQSLLSAIGKRLRPASLPLPVFSATWKMLQQENPAEFSKVETNVAAQLHDDASRAAIEGNEIQADKLNHVATVFESSARTGLLPTLNALHEAGLSQDHFHGHDPLKLILERTSASRRPRRQATASK